MLSPTKFVPFAAGPIPPELGDLTALEQLSLSHNNLTGESCIFRLIKIEINPGDALAGLIFKVARRGSPLSWFSRTLTFVIAREAPAGWCPQTEK